MTSPRLALEFVEFSPLPNAFRRMIREGDLDVSEMALVSHLLACDHGRQLGALAVPLWSRLPHANLVCRADSTLAGPKDLEGRRVGVRAYAQTSGVWVRGVLKSEYGVDLDRIAWVTMEDAHVPEYVDPPGVARATQGKLRDLLIDGRLTAIMGEREIDPSGVRTVIADADEAARQWMSRNDIVPINHVVSVRSELLRDAPWLADELIGLFTQAAALAQADGAPAPPPYGLAANRRSLQVAFDYCHDQKIVSRPYSVDEVFFSESSARH